jgi:hypothetical protein
MSIIFSAASAYYLKCITENCKVKPNPCKNIFFAYLSKSSIKQDYIHNLNLCR